MKRRLSTASFKLSVAPKSGADATVYWLVPSVTQIKRKADGTHLPEYVSCESKSKTGEDSPVSGVGTIKYAIIYATGNTSADTVYQSRITITSDMAGISFRLYVGGQKVDEKTVLVVDDGEKGKDGLPGPAGIRGRLPFPAGKWDANTTYTATDDITPIVYYEDGKTYYVMRKNGSVTGLNPVEDYGNPAGDPTWIPFENLKAIFTEILMSRFAKLASAIFWDDYMFSQHGKDANGNDTKDYSGFDPAKLDQENCPFTPNLMLDLLKGNAAIGGRKIMFNSDGSGHLANKNLIWDEEGNIYYKGRIRTPFEEYTIPIDKNLSIPDSPFINYDDILHGKSFEESGGNIGKFDINMGSNNIILNFGNLPQNARQINLKGVFEDGDEISVVVNGLYKSQTNPNYYNCSWFGVRVNNLMINTTKGSSGLIVMRYCKRLKKWFRAGYDAFLS